MLLLPPSDASRKWTCSASPAPASPISASTTTPKPAVDTIAGASALVTLLTLGYEGLTPPEYLDLMQQSGGTHLVDIRRRPQSRKPGFSKRRLAEVCAARGLSYTHLVDLGTPREILYGFREDKDAAKFHRAFSEYLDTVPEAVAELAEMARERTCCLLCYEADVAHCHRREVAERVREVLGGEGRCRVMHLAVVRD